jgi:hypothetical protein
VGFLLKLKLMEGRVNQNVDNFFKYMSRPLRLTSIEVIYTSNNIVFERADLYRDFILTLNDIIITTYLGDELTNEDEQQNHFNWCWNRTAKLLNHHKIQFDDNKSAFDYLSNFYFETFYLINKNSEGNNIIEIENIWKYIFNYNIEKPRSELDTFVSLYKVFEKSYKKL